MSCLYVVYQVKLEYVSSLCSKNYTLGVKTTTEIDGGKRDVGADGGGGDVCQWDFLRPAGVPVHHGEQVSETSGRGKRAN